MSKLPKNFYNNVDVHKLGIEDGTVITKWNGKPILQAAAEDAPDIGYSVKSNASGAECKRK